MPGTLFLLPIAALTVWFALDRRTLPIGTGLLNEWVVEPPFTSVDIEAIANARGGQPACALTRAIVSVSSPWAGAATDAPGDRAVEVAFVSWAGPRHRSWCLGWPSWWICRHERMHYANNITREQFVPARTDPNWQSTPSAVPERPAWSVSSGRLFHEPPPERTAGIDTTWMFNPAAFGILIAAGFAGGVLASGCIRLLGIPRRAPVSARIVRRGAAGGAAIGIGLVLALAIGSARTQDHLAWAPASHQGAGGAGQPEYYVRQDFFRLPWRRAELVERVQDAGFGAELARTILAHAAPESGTDCYLAVGLDEESVAHGGEALLVPASAPILQIETTRYMRRSDFGSAEPMSLPKGLVLDWDSGMLAARLSTGDPEDPSRTVRMYTDWVVLLGVAVAGSWWIPRRACVLIWSRGGEHRLARGLCPQCAYEIGSLLP